MKKIKRLSFQKDPLIKTAEECELEDKINEIIDVLNSWIFQPTLVIPSQEKKHSRELVCMRCGSKKNLNTNKDKSFVECDDCMWGIEKDGTRLADEFYSLAPRYRTKVKLQEMIDKWLDKAREEKIQNIFTKEECVIVEPRYISDWSDKYNKHFKCNRCKSKCLIPVIEPLVVICPKCGELDLDEIS